MKKLLVLMSVALVGITLFESRKRATANEPLPNVVLIISDDQAWTDYGFMGHKSIQTPNLDRLSKQSVVFRRGYVPTALCRPSLATLATGLYAHQHRITGNDPAQTEVNRGHVKRDGQPARELLISNLDRVPTVPRLLEKAGYLSFQSGKWWEGSFQRGGFTDGMTRGYPNPGGRHGDDGLSIGRKGLEPISDFMDRSMHQQKPFFLWYAPFLPHTPHNPPPRLLKKYQVGGRGNSVAKYYAMCDWFDETCGQLLDQLEQKGIEKNTLVIYVTDNGWIQNPKGNGYLGRSKRSPYEGGVRTPVLFRWPGKIKPVERPELCSSVDIVPTILAAAGVPIPEQLPGLNLLPFLTEQKEISRDTIYGEAFAHDIADIKNPDASLLYRWVIQGNSKLLLTYDGRRGRMKYPPIGSRTELFDLHQDPHEKVNLATQQPERVERLSELLQHWYPATRQEKSAEGKEGDRS
jgi:arylsulfatase A-like enzyme